jgi:tetratricopeptide (TPR) repeat protein
MRLASASEDKTVKVWDARSGAEVLSLRGHTSIVIAVSYSPDGTRLASASGDNTVKVWDARTGKSHSDSWAEAEAHRQALAPDWHTEDADSAEARGNWFGAAFHRRWLAKIQPEDRPNQALVARALANLGRWQEALDTCGRLLEHDPTLAPIYLDRARLRLALGDRAGATADTLAGLALASHSRMGWPDFARADAAAGDAAGDWASAAERYGQAVLYEAAEPEHLRKLAWAELGAGDDTACRRTCRRLYEEHRDTTDLAPLLRLSAALACALQAAPTFSNTAGPALAEAALRQARMHRIEVVVRACALLPDSGVEAKELELLARRLVAARPDHWAYRELLGAALYRGGNPDEAVRELDEAVRLHGEGSLWAKLFLALAHQRLGHVDQARQWRQQGENTDGWEEQVIKSQLVSELVAPKPAAGKE